MQMQSGTISSPSLPLTVTTRCMQRQLVRVFSITFDTFWISCGTKDKAKQDDEEGQARTQWKPPSGLPGK